MIILMGIAMIINLTAASAVAFNETVRFYDHNVKLELKYNNMISWGVHASVYVDNQKVFIVTRDFWHPKWNISDVNDQVLLKIKRSGVFQTRYEIERLVAGTTTTFKKIYDDSNASVNTLQAVPSSGEDDIHISWQFNKNVIIAKGKQLGTFEDAPFLHGGLYLTVTAGQDIAQILSIVIALHVDV